jgi:hypothetical protein
VTDELLTAFVTSNLFIVLLMLAEQSQVLVTPSWVGATPAHGAARARLAGGWMDQASGHHGSRPECRSASGRT